MKISIVTVVRNNSANIIECLRSVQEQTHTDIEHIVVDGASTDGTTEIIRAFEPPVQKFVSEPDTGIYNALNKGIAMATGQVVGILHADDLFYDKTILGRVAEALQDPRWDACHGDLLYVAKNNTSHTIRTWKSSPYQHGMFYTGWMPAHPTLFIRREHYQRHGGFNESLQIASDYELMLRFLHTKKLTTQYIPYTFTRMRVGGASNRSLKNIFRKTREDLQAWVINGQPLRRYIAVVCKNFRKLPQFLLLRQL
jgi:glycosyltransferase